MATTTAVFTPRYMREEDVPPLIITRVSWVQMPVSTLSSQGDFPFVDEHGFVYSRRTRYTIPQAYGRIVDGKYRSLTAEDTTDALTYTLNIEAVTPPPAPISDDDWKEDIITDALDTIDAALMQMRETTNMVHIATRWMTDILESIQSHLFVVDDPLVRRCLYAVLLCFGKPIRTASSPNPTLCKQLDTLENILADQADSAVLRQRCAGC